MTSQDLCVGQALFASQARYAGPTPTEQLLKEGNSPGLATNLPLEQHHRIVIAFVGMGFEAKIAAGPGVLVVCRDSRRDLANVIESADRQGYRGVISFGVAGGLASNLRTGDWVVASAVLRFTCPSCDRRGMVEQSRCDHSRRNLRSNPRRRRSSRRGGNETRTAQSDRCLRRRYGIACDGAPGNRARPRVRCRTRHHRSGRTDCPFRRASRHEARRWHQRLNNIVLKDRELSC